ncbi:MAG: sialidase family protein [Acidobacteriota bacterium]
MPSLVFLARIAGLVLAAQPSFRAPELVGGWRTSGPVLYQVNAVSTTPADDPVVYAAASIYSASESALFRSADGGKTWNTLVEAQGEFYSEILVDPRQSQRVYAGAHGSAPTASIYRSANAGQTWALAHSVSPSCSPSFAPGSTPDTVLSACGLKVLRSQDGGASWTELPTPFSVPMRLTPGASGSVLAYGASSIFRTTNDGGSWAAIASAPPGCPTLLALDVDPTDGNVLVSGTGMLGGSGFLCGGVFRSADGGKTWGDNALPDFYVTDVVIDPTSPSSVFAGASFLTGILPRGGVFQSHDGGGTWENLRVPASGAVRLALSPSGRRIHAATPVGVYDRGFRRTSTVLPRE